MRLFSFLSALIFSLLLLISSQAFEDYASLFLRQQCARWESKTNEVNLSRPLLINTEEIILEKYSPMKKFRLQNQGGHKILYCDGFDFPNGVNVSITRDGRSCLISGAPNQAQAMKNAYVVAANVKGRSLATVPILVNALVLQE
jgi:hypothetical protein